MCREVVDDCLGALRSILIGFVASIMLEKFHDILPAND